jgi:hypothetical protein
MKLIKSQSQVLRLGLMPATMLLTTIALPAFADSTNSTPPPAGLVSWWRGEGNGNDETGSHNGTLLDGIGFGAGRFGQAFSNPGPTGRVLVPDGPDLILTNSLSVAAWVYPKAISWTVLSRNGSQPGSTAYVIGMNNAQQLTFGMTSSSGLADGLSTPIALNQWYHVAGTLDGATGDMRLYINGVLAAQKSTTVRPAGSMAQAALAIGNNVQGGFPFTGLIDEVVIYSRALSPVEVAGLAAVSNAVPAIVAGPVSQTVAVGGSATFTVAASGTGPLAYQWRWIGTNIAGATGTALTLSNVQPTQAGNYAVQVTNLYGVALSSNAALTVTSGGSCVSPPSGLVSWWQAENNAADVVGGNNGTLVNGATFVPGKVGQALSLNGVNQYVSVPDKPSLRPTNLTIEAWVNFSTTSGNPIIALKPYGTGRLDSYALWYTAYGQLGGAITTVNGEGPWLTYAWTPALGTWHHVAYTFDSASSLQALYLDGAAVASGTVSGPIAYDTGPVQIGADIEYGVESFFFGGLIDEVSLFNRALSASEIAAIYSAGAAGKCLAAYPPVITLQPADRTVVAGDSASFSVAASGAQPISYQWRFNGTNINGATGSSFTLAQAQSADAGVYSVILSNGVGTALSSNALLTVNPLPPCSAPPSGLVSWWQAQGNAADVMGSNNGTLMNGAAFAPGKAGQAFSLSGANQYVSVPDSPALRPTNLTVEGWVNFSTLSGGYRCLFQKPYGTSASDSFGVVYYAGQLIAAITRTSGDGPWLTYNWTPVLGTWHHVAYTFNNASSNQVLYVDGAAVASGTVSGPIVYDTNPFLIGADIELRTPKFFFGGLIDEAALFSRTLSAAEIGAIYSAGASGKCIASYPPVVTLQPTNRTVVAGGSVTFSVAASGAQPISYQWRLNGTNLDGATGSSFTLAQTQPTDAGLYSALLANGAGAVLSSNALLTVNPPPPCVPPPSGLISWWRGEGDASDVLGAHNGTASGGLTFASGEVGRAFSFNGVNAAVDLGNWFNLQTFSIAMWVKAGASQVAYADLIDNNHNNAPWRSWTVEYENTGLHFAWDLFVTGGSYTRIPFELKTNTWQYLVLSLDSNRVAQVYLDGQVQGSGTLSGAISYDGTQFLRLGRWGGGGRYFNGLMDEVDIYNRGLTVSEIQALYNASVTGKCQEAPTILVQPAGQTITATSEATFTVSAAGTPPLRYQWRFNGTNLAGATGTALTLSNVQPAQAGNYLVVVTNAFGSVASSNAVLTVNRIPVALCADVIVPAGTTCQADASVNNGSFDPDGDTITTSQAPQGPYPLGTNLVTLTVTDPYGSSNSCSARVIVVDRTPPTLVCPGPKVLEFQDERGAIASYSVTASDACSAVSVAVSPVSGCVFQIGATPVTAQATDAWSNSAQCTFTVTVLGAQGVKSNVLAQLVALRASVNPGPPFAQKFDNAIEHLADSLTPAYWIDQIHLQPRRGNTAMNDEKLAVSKLAEIKDANHCPVAPALLQGFIDRIVKCDRLLAVICITEAAQAGMNPRKVAEDLEEVAKGDEEAAAGRYANAIEHYRNAWRHALQLRLQVSVKLDGSTQLQFIGDYNGSYRIEVSTDMVNWATLAVVTADGDGTASFTDPEAAKQPNRFYRVAPQ